MVTNVNAGAMAQVMFQNVNGFVFNPMTIVALDFLKYEPGKPGRTVIFHLLGPVSRVMVDTAADAAYKWFLESTGESPLPGGLMAPGRRGVN